MRDDLWCIDPKKKNTFVNKNEKEMEYEWRADLDDECLAIIGVGGSTGWETATFLGPSYLGEWGASKDTP